MADDKEKPRPITIRILKDEDNPCPKCGAYWGHPDKDLDFTNRPKIFEDEISWWRCYNPKCDLTYYHQGMEETASE